MSWSPELCEAVRALVASGKSARDIASETGLTRRAIIGGVWRRNLGPWQTKSGVKPSLTIPADFAERYHAPMTYAELADYYGCSRTTIGSYVQRLGLSRPKLKRQKPRLIAELRATTMTGGRDMSLAARAVDECLRHYSGVHRCDADGRTNPRGTHWRRNGYVLTDDEVIARAERLGWDADAWRRVAA